MNLIRRNLSIDLGNCGHSNSHRDANRGELLGLVFPQHHGGIARTMHMTVQKLFVAFSKSVRSLALGFIDNIYHDDKRAKLFARRINIENIIEAMRVAITDGLLLILDPHSDKQNDHESTNMKAVACFSWNLYVNGRLVRLSIIGFQKQSVTDFMKLYKDREPLLRQIVAFRGTIAEDRKKVSASLLIPRDGPTRTSKPHLDKLANYYSIFGTTITLVMRRWTLIKDKHRTVGAMLDSVPLAALSLHGGSPAMRTFKGLTADAKWKQT